jgi:hypothetical protein
MDYITGDGYRGWARRGQPFNFPPMDTTLIPTSEYWNRFGKPGLITECGCCWFGGPDFALENDVHQLCWAGWMTHLAGTSLFWWFEYVDEKDLYRRYGAFARYAKGEDKRGRDLEIDRREIDAESPTMSELQMLTLTDRDGGYAWIYDIKEYDVWTKSREDQGIYHEKRDYVSPEFLGARAPITGLRNGAYRVEVWDTTEGKIVATLDLETRRGSITVPLPPFRKDIALKIKPAVK